jgi:NADH dehydrogenase [ubiquinone] 1 alpha subcomplex assembly factor 7
VADLAGAAGAAGAGLTEAGPAVASEVPERLDRFMARANAAYYATHDPFADFTTAPEISQVFGEVIGLWAAVAWQALGSPDPVLLVEAGPGRGTLMADALRAVGKVVPGFAAALRVHFMETSPRLRAAQAVRVPGATWHDSLETVPAAPMILVANEFVDALPIRQFVRRGDGWTERFVADGAWVEQAADAADVLPGRDAAEGQVVEVNELARAFVASVARRVRRHPGVGLFVDYGPARSAVGDSLQAIAGRKPVPPLAPPGSADLTAHVDFADMAMAAQTEGAAVQGPVTQGEFLVALGVFQRTEALVRGRTPEQTTALRQATQRLADPRAMGDLFKVLAVTSPGCPGLPGVSAG